MTDTGTQMPGEEAIARVICDELAYDRDKCECKPGKCASGDHLRCARAVLALLPPPAAGGETVEEIEGLLRDHLGDVIKARTGGTTTPKAIAEMLLSARALSPQSQGEGK